MLQVNILWILSGLLLIPYLLWGVHMLRMRLHLEHELRPKTELLTIGALVPYYILQYGVLSMWLGKTPGLFTLAILGLFLSGAALYGHMVLSIGSLFLVDFMMSSGGEEIPQPQYGPAEACERQGEYEGALREYTAVAHQFPQDPTTALRIADNLLKLDRAEEAVHWFERGLRYVYEEKISLPITNRLSEILSRQLKRPLEAQKVLAEFLARFPDSEYVESLRFRINSLQVETETAVEAVVEAASQGLDEDFVEPPPPSSPDS